MCHLDAHISYSLRLLFQLILIKYFPKNDICHRFSGKKFTPKFFYLSYISELIIKDCSKLGQSGLASTGIYYINPDGGSPIQVLCDMTANGRGWTVFQRRLNGSVDFFQGWESYKNGFGDLNGEFWLGNDNLHRLTAFGDVMLRVDLEDFDGNITYAEYTTFQVADEADKYRITIGGYNGTAGDSMVDNGGQTQR